MYKDNFKNHLITSTWRISVTHGMIHLLLHVTFLNVPPTIVRNHLH